MKNISKKIKINKITALCLIVLIICSLISSCLFSVPVYAAWTAIGLRSTIASLICSLLMSSGAAVTNDAWLSQLNTAYGVTSSIGTIEDALETGLLIESGGHLIDNGLAAAIEAVPEYTTLGLDTIFSTTAADEALVAGTAIASGGTNLSLAAIMASEVGVIGIAGGVVAGVAGGIGLYFIGKHFVDYFKGNLNNGVDLDDEYARTLASNGEAYYRSERKHSSGAIYNTIIIGNDSFPACYSYKSGSYLNTSGGLYSFDGNNKSYKVYGYKNGTLIDERTENSNYSTTTGYEGGPNLEYEVSSNVPTFSDFSTYNDYIENVRNGSIKPSIVSPDVLSSQGNVRPTIDNNGNLTYPNITPQINPTSEGVEPFTMDEYMDFVDTAVENTNNGDTDDVQGALFDLTLQDKIRDLQNQETEDPVPDPTPDYTNPEVVPSQPDYPSKDPVSSNDIEESAPYTTPGLQNKFPFCIPWDLKAIFTKFTAGRQAPNISWRFKVDRIGLDYTFSLDLSDFDNAAQLLRTLQLIAFVVGLAAATRDLIGAR